MQTKNWLFNHSREPSKISKTAAKPNIYNDQLALEERIRERQEVGKDKDPDSSISVTNLESKLQDFDKCAVDLGEWIFENEKDAAMAAAIAASKKQQRTAVDSKGMANKFLRSYWWI